MSRHVLVALTIAIALMLTPLAPAQDGGLLQDLVCYLPFDGNLNDSSGNGNDGATAGSSGGFQAGVVGQGALIPDAANSYIYIPGSEQAASGMTFGASTDFTVAIWMNMNTYGTGEYQFVFDNVNYGSGPNWSGDPGWGIFIRTNGTGGPIAFIEGAAFGGGNLNFTDMDNWHHLVFVDDRDGPLYAYWDGNLTYANTAAQNPDGSVDSGYPVTIGQHGSGNGPEPFGAVVDEFAVWRRALSGAEVKRIYNGSQAGVGVGALGSGPWISAELPLQFSFQVVGDVFTYEDTRTITVENMGSADLNITGLSFGGSMAGEFSFGPGATAPQTIPAGETWDFDVIWDPGSTTVTGPRDVSVQIASNDPATPMVTLPLGGDVRPQPLDDLFVYLDFENNLTDQSGSGNDAQTVGTGSYEAGMVGQGYRVPNPSGDYLTFPGSDQASSDFKFGTDTDFTFTAWIQMKAHGTNFYSCLMGDVPFEFGAGAGWLAFVRTNGTGGVQKQVHDGAGGYTGGGWGNLTFPVDEWHHYAFLCERGGDFFVYEDGQYMGGVPASWGVEGDMTGTLPFNIGQWGDAGYPEEMGFVIDEFAGWKRIVTPVEIGQIYNFSQNGKGVDEVVPQAIMTVRTPINPFDFAGETKPTPMVFEVTNTGFVPLILNNFVLSGPNADEFSLPSSGTILVNPGSTANLNVIWNPDDELIGTRQATFSFEHNDIFKTSPYEYVMGPTVADPATMKAGLENGLVCHLKFDGDLKDATPRGNDARSSSTAEGVSFGIGPVGSGALNIEGTGGYATLDLPPDLQFGTDVDYSVSFWIRPTYANNWPNVIGNVNLSTWDTAWCMSLTAPNVGGTWQMQQVDVNEAWVQCVPPASGKFYDGGWHHVVGTCDRDGYMKAYEDGELVQARYLPPYGTIDLNTDEIMIGTYNEGFGSGGQAAFLIDDVGIWRRELKYWEVAWIHRLGMLGLHFMSDVDLSTYAAADEAWYLYE